MGKKEPDNYGTNLKNWCKMQQFYVFFLIFLPWFFRLKNLKIAQFNMLKIMPYKASRAL